MSELNNTLTFTAVGCLIGAVIAGTIIWLFTPTDDEASAASHTQIGIDSCTSAGDTLRSHNQKLTNPP